MISSIHGKKVRLCQWSFEIIVEGQPVFKFPYHFGDKIRWKGCFITPQCALAALNEYCNSKPTILEAVKIDLHTLFQASLQRADKGEATYDTMPHVTIQPAPSPATLSYLGGPHSPDAFRKLYDPERVMQKIFKQTIRPEEDDDDELSKTTSMCGWKASLIAADSKITPEYYKSLQTIETLIPRNAENVVTFLRGAWADHSSKMGATATETVPSFVMYFHPTIPDMFAIGDTSAWNESKETNKLAFRIFGKKSPVFGDVLIYHKKNLKINGKRSKKEEAPKVEPPTMREEKPKEDLAASKAPPPPPAEKEKKKRAKSPATKKAKKAEAK